MGLAAYSADRLPRTTSVVRKAAKVAGFVSVSSRPGVALRVGVIAAVSRFGPGLVPRSFDGTADRRSPRHTYASEAGTPAPTV